MAKIIIYGQELEAAASAPNGLRVWPPESLISCLEGYKRRNDLAYGGWEDQARFKYRMMNKRGGSKGRYGKRGLRGTVQFKKGINRAAGNKALGEKGVG